MQEKRIADLTSISELILEKMLSGEMRSVLPLSIILDGGSKTGIFSCDGLVSVSERSFDPVNILELTERIFSMIEELKDHLIFPEEIVLNDKILFIDKQFRMTRICIIPETEETNEKENMLCLLNCLKELTDDTGRAYMDVFISEYQEKRFSYSGVLTFLEEMKREAGMK